MEQKEPEKQPEPVAGKSRKLGGKHLAVIFAIIALILIGLLGWLWMNSQDTKKDLQDKNKKLQSQIDDLKKQVAAAKKSAASGGEADDAAACPDATDAFRETIADAVSSQNYAALEATMTDPITVVYAATEFGGPLTPAEAVSAMDYLNNGDAPWDFDLPDAAVDGYGAGFYEQYFPEGAYVGKSSNGVVVSFVFECGQISQIFIASHEDVL